MRVSEFLRIYIEMATANHMEASAFDESVSSTFRIKQAAEGADQSNVVNGDHSDGCSNHDQPCIVESDSNQSNVLNGSEAADEETRGQKRGREEEDGSEKKWPGWPGDNVFRLLVPVQKVGGIIGRKGELVKKICESTRARIKILEGIPGTMERIVMVTAKEDPEMTLPPAMDGLLRVHRRLMEAAVADGNIFSPSSFNNPVSSRLLVAVTQAGSLIGRQGATIKSIQDASGATVRVMPIEELPLCALPDDRVVEIQGEANSVQMAMELVAAHLRKFLVDRSVLQLFELNRSVSNKAYSQQQQHSTTSNGSWGSSSQFPTSSIQIVTQMMQIPLSYADAVIGTNGNNISYMRRSSGATITIQETSGMHNEMTVEMNGTAAQVHTAQQLIQNVMAGISYEGVDFGATSSSYSYS